jgi:hypothetical protein
VNNFRLNSSHERNKRASGLFVRRNGSMALLLIFVLYFVSLLCAEAPASFDVVFYTTVKNGTSGTMKVCAVL